jgi:TRAP-type mannitol/chloroaromatic compound transport system substrate-binding protein
MPAGQIVPAFEVLDATSKKVLDGWHSIAYYWVGKNPAAALFAAPPAAPSAWITWITWVALRRRRPADVARLLPERPQAERHRVARAPVEPSGLGWFKKPLQSVADIKGLKCRQTGLNAEVYAKMGMSVVNMAGGEIVPSAQRGVIDCAEWVGGVEDLRLGLHTVFKYHYTPGMHENNSIGELGFNLDVWKSFTPAQQDAVNSAVNDTFISGSPAGRSRTPTRSRSSSTSTACRSGARRPTS